MSITYAAGTGTLINTGVFNETVVDQSQQTGNNTVVVSDTIGNAGNGQEGDGSNGIGDSFVGRLLAKDLGLSTEERRMCISDVAGTGTTRILTVHEDWDTNPVITTDTLHAAYEPADIEDGTASGGISFNTRTGLFELTNVLTIQSGGFFQVMNGTALEVDDRGATIAFILNSGSYLAMGYEAGGAYVNGGLVVFYNNVTGEQGFQAQSGSKGWIYDSLFWAQLVAMQWEHANGAGLKFYGSKLLNNTDETHLFDMDVTDYKISGKGATTEIVRVDAGTVSNGMVLSNVDTLETASGDTTTETIELAGVIFSGVTDLITLVNNKTYNMIDPVWPLTSHTDVNSAAVTGSAAINEKTSAAAIVQEADGTLLQNALLIVYENTLDDLVVEEATDVNGVASSSFNYLEMLWTTGTGATTTRSGHALQIDKWLYEPLVFDIASDEAVSNTYTLALDSNIVQTTQATALTDGSGIVWAEDANPSEVFDFTLGSGTALAGMILTFTSGAVGTITEIASGDSTAGEIHLKTRNGTAIANGDTFSRTGGTAGTFSGTYTNDSSQPFSVYIEANAKSYQVQHDYWAARTSEIPLNSVGEIANEWRRGAQKRVLYKSGDDFYTERSNGKGIYIINGGAGSVSHYTDDNGGTWQPPATVTLQVTAAYLGSGVANIKVRYQESDGTLIAEGVTNGSGVFSYGIAAGLLPYTNAKVIVRDKRFEDPPDTVLNITTAGFDLVIGLQPDTDINLP